MCRVVPGDVVSVRFDTVGGGDLLKIEPVGLDILNVSPSKNLTMCAWAKRKVDSGAFATVLYGQCNGANDMFIETDAGGDRIFGDETGGTESVLDSGVPFTIDVWYFVVYARSDTSRSLYYGTEAGGTLTPVRNTDTRTYAGTMSKFWIGNDPFSEPWNGEISLVRLFSSKLSDAQIDAEWRSLTPVQTARGDWRLATAASATTDSSGNALTLTSGGALTNGGADPVPPVLGLTANSAIGSVQSTAQRSRSYRVM